MRCPYCQQNIRVQGRFCPRCGEQIFGRPVRPPAESPGATPPPQVRPAPVPTRPPASPPSWPGGLDIDLEQQPRTAPAGAGRAGVPRPAGEEEFGKSCPFCRFPIKTGEQVMICPACHLPHHHDCWAENQGCTTYGCQGMAAARPAYQTPAYQTPASAGPQPTPWQWTGQLMAAELAARANRAMWMSIVGLFCCQPLALVGMFMGISAYSDSKRHAMAFGEARNKAVAAIIIGAIGTLIGVATLILSSVQSQ